MILSGGDGDGVDHGHLTGTTAAAITGPGATTTVTVAGESFTVSCPLLDSGETLPGLTQVIISCNRQSGDWEIIWFREIWGHLTGTTSSAITGPGATTTVAGKTVRCPLLASGKTIAAGTMAVISRNQSTGNWEIIEAQCAEE